MLIQENFELLLLLKLVLVCSVYKHERQEYSGDTGMLALSCLPTCIVSVVYPAIEVKGCTLWACLHTVQVHV